MQYHEPHRAQQWRQIQNPGKPGRERMATPAVSTKEVTYKSKRETATEKMLDSLVTPEVIKAVDDAIRPNIEKFNKEHPMLAVGYDFIVKIDDGEATVKGGSKRDNRKMVRLLRKLASLELRQSESKHAA
jgi:hypothetical protein